MTEPLVRFELCDGVAHVTLSHPMAGTLDPATVRAEREPAGARAGAELRGIDEVRCVGANDPPP